MADQVTCVSIESNYFRQCLGEAYTPVLVGKHEGVHPQEIGSDEMMEQKLDYIHNNPVQRGLVAGQEHWRFSSAHEWLVGASPCFKCDPWR